MLEPRPEEMQFCDICGSEIEATQVWYDIREDEDGGEFDRTWDVCSFTCLVALGKRLELEHAGSRRS